jgi:hypothetical protein
MAFHPVFTFRIEPEAMPSIGQEDQSRVAPPVDCVAPTGSTAERPTGEVTDAVRTDLAAECRRDGHQRGKATASGLHVALMGAYVSMGPMTDAEMASYLKLERTTVNARRNELVEAGRVVKCGTKINARTRVKNVLWGVR